MASTSSVAATPDWCDAADLADVATGLVRAVARTRRPARGPDGRARPRWRRGRRCRSPTGSPGTARRSPSLVRFPRDTRPVQGARQGSHRHGGGPRRRRRHRRRAGRGRAPTSSARPARAEQIEAHRRAGAGDRPAGAGRADRRHRASAARGAGRGHGGRVRPRRHPRQQRRRLAAAAAAPHERARLRAGLPLQRDLRLPAHPLRRAADARDGRRRRHHQHLVARRQHGAARLHRLRHQQGGAVVHDPQHGARARPQGPRQRHRARRRRDRRAGDRAHRRVDPAPARGQHPDATRRVRSRTSPRSRSTWPRRPRRG